MYYNHEIIQNTHEGMSFNLRVRIRFFYYYFTRFVELHYGLYQIIENDILKKVNNILYRKLVIIFGGLIQFDIMLITNKASMQ
ncbi:hypothetical protein AHAS_Ahas15G0122400 [Arachis hypogaea]